MSRFENTRRRVDLFRLADTLATTVIRRHRHRLNGQKCKMVTIDMDPTDDPVHGAQQLSMFNGHHDARCYLPMLGFVSFNDEAEQYLVAAAYVLMQELRLRMKSTPLARAQIETLRLQLLKIGGQVKRSVRRIVIHLAASHPWRRQW